ncbi:MAG: phosphatidate cytidylyltransferase [Planctomycetota bacterium]|nr:phosphatidate cytidylyltransferase [Planctomycetota bacterium]
MPADMGTWLFVGGVLLLLGAATGVGQFMQRQPESGLNSALIDAFNRRVRAWWLLCTLLAAAVIFPSRPGITVLLFGLLAFWALREFITLTPTRLSDHRALFWIFVVFTPLQFVLVGMGREMYGLYSILIPVYGVLFVAARVAFSGDPKRFMERTAIIQSGLVICVYCLSFAPALLYLELFETSELASDNPKPWQHNGLLLFWFVVMVQLGDVLQYGWGKLMGQHAIAPSINPSRTWEGFLGGIGSTALVGAALSNVTPFTMWQAACMAMVVALAGFAGGMAMSAIKRDRGVQDFGTLVVGHGGVLDRIDSLCFATPVFFHLTRAFFTPGM